MPSVNDVYAQRTARDVARVTERIEATADALVQVLAMEAWGLLKVGTPVDKGICAGNWNLSVGVPDETFDPSRSDLSSRGREPEQIPPPETLGRVRAGETVYLVNATPYVEVLEYGGYPNPPKGGAGKTVGGFSTQAPGGWVRRAAQELGKRAEEFAARLRAGGLDATLGVSVRRGQ